MGRILALDPGEKRVGLAVSDELRITAQGLPTLERQGIKRDLPQIAKLVGEYGVDEVVVGVPYHMDGTVGASAERAMALIEQLSELLTIPVTPWDERLTTKMADRVLTDGRVSRDTRKRSRDRLAAVLILQSYLDAMSHSPDPAQTELRETNRKAIPGDASR